jgi:4-hydroxy-tetrahydrodipicolinate synthase
MTTFKGTGVALVTPFNQDLSVDFEALKTLVDLQITGGTDFLVVMGTTAESPTLDQKEKDAILQTVIEVANHRLPIVYGVGGNNTKLVGEALKRVPKGVDGILSVSPYYNKPTQKGIVAHFNHLTDQTDLPFILYNVPGRTGSNMLPETTLQLAEIKNVVAVKEASGNFEQIMEVIRNKPLDFTVLSGDDAITMPLIACGAEGVISVVANALPEKFSKMVRYSMQQDFEKARSIHNELLPITKYFFEEGNPAGVKVALAHRSIAQNVLRLPLVGVSSKLTDKIQKEMEQLLQFASL